MKKRKYNYMIVGTATHLCIGMEIKRGNDHVRASARIAWTQVEDAKIDVVETNLDILECQLERQFAGIPTFDEVFGTEAK